MADNYLNATGLAYLWDKITSYVQDAISGISGGGAQTSWYGTSNTAAGTAAKVVTCSGFELKTGAVISVLFSTANTAATPTLNVNGTGAKTIYAGSGTLNSTTNVLKWSANTVLLFVYDGTYFRYIASRAAASVVPPDGAGNWYGTSSTAAGSAAKVSTIANYLLMPGARVSVTFSTSNTVEGAITLNVNGTGAKTIYYNNAATSAGNPLLWSAGETLTFIYSGSYYYLVGRSRIPASIESAYGFNRLSVGDVDLYDPIGGATDFGTCDTADGTATKVVSTTYQDFGQIAGHMLAVSFTNENTLEDALFLNANGEGALPINVNGEATSQTNPLKWMPGETLLFVISMDPTTFDIAYELAGRCAYNSPATMDDIDAIGEDIGAIGTRVTTGAESGSSASVASGSSVALASINLNPGTWIVTGSVKFAANASGVRRITIEGTSGSTSTNSEYSVISPAASGTNTILNKTRIMVISTAATLNLTAYQNSGSSLTCYATVSAVRIKG